MTYIGLSIITLSWMLQLVVSGAFGRVMSPFFPLLYAIGVAFLVVEGYSSGMTTMAHFNLASLVVALAVFLVVILWGSRGR